MTTKKQPPADPNLTILLRGKVRDVMTALPPGRKATRAMIDDAIRVVFGYSDAKDDQISAAIEWNHERNLIDYHYNHDADRDEWFLTERGKAKEGIK